MALALCPGESDLRKSVTGLEPSGFVKKMIFQDIGEKTSLSVN